MSRLSGKVAIITGAAHGIGRATALLFAAQGARVVVNDKGCSADGTGRDEAPAQALAEEINGAGGQAVACASAVEQATEVEQLFALATSRFGRVDVLINSAGIARDRDLTRLTEVDFDAVIAVQLKGTFLCTQAAARLMKRQGSGSIVNTTGSAGLLGNFGQSSYSAAAAGIYGLTRTASIELQRYNVRVNAIAPLAKTRLTQELPIFEHVESMQPKHVAPVHLFLACDLSAEITGTVLGVAGGRLSSYKLVESPGKFKDSDDGVWTPEEIAEQLDAAGRL